MQLRFSTKLGLLHLLQDPTEPIYKKTLCCSKPLHSQTPYNMDCYLTLLLILVPFLWACTHVLRWRLSGAAKRRPPGPKPLPIVGNLFQLGDLPHRCLTNLSRTYGPVMSLKLGTVTTTVLSSSKGAKELLHKFDNITANRVIPDSAHALDHHKVSVAWLPNSPPWRKLRRIMNTEMFTAQRLGACEDLRIKKVHELLDHVEGMCEGEQALDVGQAGFTTLLNLMSNSLFSLDFASYGSELSHEYKDTVVGAVNYLGKPNLADFFPLLRFFDLQGVRRGTTFHFKKLLAMIDDIIVRKMQQKETSSSGNMGGHDLLDALLNANKKEESSERLTMKDLRHLIMDLFIAGTDSTTTTLEWTMAYLLRKPEKMARLQAEIREKLGNDGKKVRESDIAKLPYLQAVFKEILRLHPPGPFLLPRTCEVDLEISGYHIPKNSRIMVNAWAIGRDPSRWPNPDSFVPERFLDTDSVIDYKGHDFDFIPFGAGRRICPGMPLAHRMLHLMLVSLLCSFDWKLEKGMKPEDIDLRDKHMISLQKAEPLRVIPAKVAK